MMVHREDLTPDYSIPDINLMDKNRNQMRQKTGASTMQKDFSTTFQVTTGSSFSAAADRVQKYQYMVTTTREKVLLGIYGLEDVKTFFAGFNPIPEDEREPVVEYFKQADGQVREIKSTWDVRRRSSVKEMVIYGESFGSLVAVYRGDVFKIRKHMADFELMSNNMIINYVHKEELEAIYKVRFEVMCKGRWFECLMLGGSEDGVNEYSVSLTIKDEYNYTGLATPADMHELGTKLTEKDIEEVRIWLSKPFVSD